MPIALSVMVYASLPFSLISAIAFLLLYSANLTAQEEFTVTLAVSASGAGTVSGEGTYPVDATAKAEASPFSGWIFSGWSGDAFRVENPLSLNGPESHTYVAQFLPDYRDFDSDGLTNHEEVTIFLSNPNDPDTDHDGVSDGDEYRAGTNLLVDEGGELLIYEGFDYPPGLPLINQGGNLSDFGWQGKWGNIPAGGTNMAGAIVSDGNLDFTDLETKGQHLFISGAGGSVRIGRELEAPLQPVEGDSLYISWIGQRLGDAQEPATTSPPNPFPRGADIRFWNSTGEARLNLGNLSNESENTWKVVTRDWTFDTGVPFTNGPNFFVLRIDFTGEGIADTLHLWINPDLSAPEDLSTAQTYLRAEESRGPWKLREVTHIGFFVGDASSDRPHAEFIMDELRIGTGFRSVVPRVPNPLDSDKDDLPNTVESNSGIFVSAEDTGTDPTLPDTDWDGLSDGDEVLVYFSDPNNPDTDKDGLTDGAEVLTHGSSPLLEDSDGDTIPDPDEVALTSLGFKPGEDSSALIPLIAKFANAFGLFRSDQIEQLVTTGFTIKPDPEGDDIILQFNLWSSEGLDEWILMDLSGADVRGTDSGLELRLPFPSANTYYQVEAQEN